MKLFSLFLTCFFIIGCTEPYHEEKDKFYSVMPEGLEGCRVFYLYAGNDSLNIVRCPNSSTTANYKSGKTTKTVATIETAEHSTEHQPIDREKNQLKQQVRVLREQLNAIESQLEEEE